MILQCAIIIFIIVKNCTSLDYFHKNLLTQHVRGVERNIIKNTIKRIKPFYYKKLTILNCNKVVS